MPLSRFTFISILLLVCGNAWGQCIPPSIQMQPLSRTVVLGDIVTLSVTATGTAPLSYGWLSLPNGAPAAPVGQNSPQYTTPPITGTIAYNVSVNNACGSVLSQLAVLTVQASAPPTAYQIANSASAYLSGQNGFGIAQGSLFVVYGNGLGPVVLQQASSYPIAPVLAGTSIQINMSGGSYSAPMIYTSSKQIAAILPSTVPAGDGTLVVSYNGTPAFPIPIHVVKSAFGIFSVNSNGAGAGVIQDANNRQLTFTQPAHPGDTVVIWGTGLGPVNGAEASGPLPGNVFTPEVFVGNQAVTAQYAGRSGCCAALDQIVIQIPPNIEGCFVPLAVRINGAVSNFVSLPVGRAGQGCADIIGFSPDLLTKAAAGTGLTLGGIVLGPLPALQNAGFNFTSGVSQRLSTLLGTTITEQDLRTIIRLSGSRRGRGLKVALKKYAPLLKARNIDPATITSLVSTLNFQGAAASFPNLVSPDGFSALIAGILPPPGTCTVGNESPLNSKPAGVGSRTSDAGPQLQLSGPGGPRTLNLLPGGSYQLALGPNSSSANPGLPSGTYTISSPGGIDVGGFTASIDIGSMLTWTDKAAVGFIDRSAPLTIHWSGGPSSGYVVFGGAASGSGAPTAFTCVEDIRKQSLTVPDFVLSAMPHTSNGSVFLMAHPLQNSFSAPGVDVGFFADLSSDSKQIGFQ